jgi:hypothetical protein
VTYAVTLRFLGVAEEKAYQGGSNDGASFQVGGAPVDSAANLYALTVSDPAATYYVNRQYRPGVPETYPMDFVATVAIAGGATVLLVADPVDGAETQNRNAQSVPYTVPGVTHVAQPYDGQFIEMHVVSVKE